MTRPTPRTQKKILSAAGITCVGAAAMYLCDPDQGRRRRAVLRERIVGTSRRMRRRTGRRARYMEGRAKGFAHHFRGAGSTPPIDDTTLKHKIESEVLRFFDASHLNVNVDDGVAVLRGQLGRPEEIRGLERAVEGIRGIVGVRNLVHLPQG